MPSSKIKFTGVRITRSLPRALLFIILQFIVFVLAGCAVKRGTEQDQTASGTITGLQTALPQSKIPVGESLGQSETNFSSSVAMEQLISKLDSQMIVELQKWAIAILDKSGGEFEVFEPKLPLVRELMPEQGIPGVLVWEQTSEIGPSVMLMWRHAPIYAWGLILGKSNLQPRSPWYEVKELKPGVFAYYCKNPEPVPGSIK